MSSLIAAISEQPLIPSCLTFSLGFVVSLAGENPHWNPPSLPQWVWNERVTPRRTCHCHSFDEDG